MSKDYAPATQTNMPSGERLISARGFELEDGVSRKNKSVPTYSGLQRVAPFAASLPALAVPIVSAAATFKLLWNTGSSVIAGIIFITCVHLLIFVPCLAANKFTNCQLRRFPRVCGSMYLIGILLLISLCAFIWHYDVPQSLNTDFDQKTRIAVIGAGPSGLSAAWMLAKSGRHVTLFDANAEVGGHSKSYHVSDDAGDFDVDLGFIFNKINGYPEYKLFAEAFDAELVDSALNTSSYRNGKMWDNTGKNKAFSDSLEEEIDKFMEFVHQPVSTLRLLTPLSVWIWWHGFSNEFWEYCIESTMSVLFVMKMGLAKQSAQAVLNYFKEDDGFTHLRYDHPKVQRTAKGSQHMWFSVAKDIKSQANAAIQLNSKVTSVNKEGDGTWTLTFADGKLLPGFSDVIMAIPANVAKGILYGHWLQRLLMDQISYYESTATLHTDAETLNFPELATPTDDDLLYFVGINHMSGRIASVFGRKNRQDLILTVHGTGEKPLPIKNSLWSIIWEHHCFNLWEIVISRKFVPFVNGRGGLHLAGDWVKGVGHNDAINAGVAAACRVGFEAPASNALLNELQRKC